jgi:competence protein ComGC
MKNLKINKKNKVRNKNGYAVLELLFYISLLSVLCLLVISAMVTMAKSFKETSIYGELVQSGTIMERMSREIKASYEVSSISANDLKLNTKDIADVNKTIEFVLSGTDIHFLENDVLTGNLNTPNIIVTGLTFTQITTTKGKAIKIILSARSSNDKLDRVQNFYNTIVLRNNY